MGRWLQTLQDKVFKTEIEVAILAELDKGKKVTKAKPILNNHPGASTALSETLIKDFRERAKHQHIAAARTHSSGHFKTQDST